MKEYYPERETIPTAWLVAPKFQPDFIWSPDEQGWQVTNIGRESIDKYCETGDGNKPAVICLETGEVFTFRQIKEASDRLAGALIAAGVKVGERLALRYASRPAAIIAATAAWKAGAVVVPIPTQARRSEIEFYLKDTDARWVIVLNEGDLYSELEAVLPATGVKGVIIGEKSPGMAGESLEALIEQGNASLAELNNLIVTAGYKVAPGEVEQVLLTHPQVREAAVTGIADPLRGQVVAAFIVVKEGEGDDVLAHELQEWCKRHLAPYKYPRKVFFCNALPRDPVGKVQIRTLVHSVTRVEQ